MSKIIGQLAWERQWILKDAVHDKDGDEEETQVLESRIAKGYRRVLPAKKEEVYKECNGGDGEPRLWKVGLPGKNLGADTAFRICKGGCVC